MREAVSPALIRVSAASARLSVADSGEAFGLDYVVLDEQRYVMFVLKFGT